ncbi:MAG: cation transporter [Clostridium sp.]|nr:cation transporter [Clostridium sp.]MCM1548093.1 cation transporter [Ruminococcus sp.]
MKKVYKLEELDCANCAAKMENEINKIEGVQKASISFMTQKLTIEADESKIDEIMKKAAKVCKKIEPDCRIIMK